jgi:hypothetical protein
MTWRERSPRVGQLVLPPPAILLNPPELDRWFAELTPDERGRFSEYLTRLIAAQPATKQAEIQRNMVRIQATAVKPSGVGDADGLGFIGSAISAVTGAAVSIYTSKQSAKLQNSLAGKASNTQLQVAVVQQIGQKGIAQAMADAQIQAAKEGGTAAAYTAEQAAAASVLRTETFVKYGLPIMALAGLGYFLLKKRIR